MPLAETMMHGWRGWLSRIDSSTRAGGLDAGQVEEVMLRRPGAARGAGPGRSVGRAATPAPSGCRRRPARAGIAPAADQPSPARAAPARCGRRRTPGTTTDPPRLMVRRTASASTSCGSPCAAGWRAVAVRRLDDHGGGRGRVLTRQQHRVAAGRPRSPLNSTRRATDVEPGRCRAEDVPGAREGEAARRRPARTRSP